jgi:transposase InsO family protein
MLRCKHARTLLELPQWQVAALTKGVISDDIHLVNEKLREWEDYYNYHHPHGALAGQTPYERLLEKTRAEVSPGS